MGIEHLVTALAVAGFITVFGGIFVYAIHELVQTEIYLHKRRRQREARKNRRPPMTNSTNPRPYLFRSGHFLQEQDND